MNTTSLEPTKKEEINEASESIHVDKESKDIIAVTKKKCLAVIDSDSECDESTKSDKIVLNEEINNTVNIAELISDTSTNSSKKVNMTSIIIVCAKYIFLEQMGSFV